MALRLVEKLSDLEGRPRVASDPGRRGWGGRPSVPLGQGYVGPSEVVVHVVDRDGVSVVLDLLTERVGQAGELTHPHSHREVLALDVGGRDALRIGVARDDPLVDSGADGG